MLANALLGEAGDFELDEISPTTLRDHPDAGTTVRLGLIRSDDTKIIYKDLKRAPLKPGCQVLAQ